MVVVVVVIGKVRRDRESRDPPLRDLCTVDALAFHIIDGRLRGWPAIDIKAADARQIMSKRFRWIIRRADG